VIPDFGIHQGVREKFGITPSLASPEARQGLNPGPAKRGSGQSWTNLSKICPRGPSRLLGADFARAKSGMTLVEVMIATSIFLIAVIGILSTYVKYLELDEISRGSAVALQAANSKVEQIKNTPFNSIFSTYNNSTFTIAGVTGIGVVYVDNSNPKLLEVKVVFCWRMKGGRVMGEDTNLNGVLNTGEDKNGNGKIDSYVQVVTRIFG
jgi:hypothetical protein